MAPFRASIPRASLLAAALALSTPSLVLAQPAVPPQPPVPAAPPQPPAPPAPREPLAPPEPPQALAAPLPLYEAGRQQDAQAAAERVLQSLPADIQALYVVIRIAQEQQRQDDAIRLTQQMIRHHPGMVATWELATQVYQAAGDLDRRDMALRQLIDTQAASIDRNLRGRPFILRDRIIAHGRRLLVQEHFDTNAPDSIRYVFLPEAELRKPLNYLMLVTDWQTTANWREAGILGPDKRAFHLDSVFATPDGRQARAMYAAWPDMPDYDTVRAKVMEIIRGNAKPMTGPVGGLGEPVR